MQSIGVIYDGKENTDPNRPSGYRLAGFDIAARASFYRPARATMALIEAGYTEQLLLSHDAGWYNPARSDGLPDDGFRGYTALTKEFLPALLERGISEEQMRLITVDNPARAFAF